MRMYRYVAIFLSLIMICSCTRATEMATDQPALVVGIVVDQMRYDYLVRYWPRFGEGGFKRLVTNGFTCEQAHFTYVPTYTAVGHSAIYTGTVPAYNGIVGNNWYDRTMGKATYVTDDSTVASIGTTSDAGKMSPRRLLSTTITDELRLVSNFKSKVIGISLKDRASILPAGHRPNGAFWYDGESGNWISSSYYFPKLPAWVDAFNTHHYPDSILAGTWSPLLPPDRYGESLADTQPYKNPFTGTAPPHFPYDLASLKKELGYELLKRIPYGNTFTIRFAEEAIRAERMGQGSATDFLALSLSSTDYVGHQFGVRAVETEDTYLRLDRDMAQFLAFLDAHVGKGRYIVFLTADHGASENAAHMKSIGVPAGQFHTEAMLQSLRKKLADSFGSGQWILDYQNRYLYLNTVLLKQKNILLSTMLDSCKYFLEGVPGMAAVLTPDEVVHSHDPYVRQILNGYNRARSGDLVLQLQPGWYEGDEEVEGGTTHGSGYAYDTHVPLLWFGWKIPHGATQSPVTMCDIAPTLAAIFHCDEPNACIGTPILDIVKQLPLRR
jgi:predicted AlkP superfamily pyrophosphatase or phosphodiesterase